MRTYNREIGSDSPATFVSVVIAVRNEAEQIGVLLTCLSRQNYPSHLFEVIVSDDFSEDRTRNIVNEYTRQHTNIRLISAQERQPTGKKAALNRAIENATGELVITTDGDCKMGGEWISAMVHHYAASQANFFIGPVNITEGENGWFSQLQTLEFMSITGVTGGAAGAGNPVMCNGANLAFRREDWLELRHQTGGKQYSSGDDVFLLHAFKKRFHKSIRFVRDIKALVTTHSSPTPKEFFTQRSRWAGKSAGFTDLFTLGTGLITALTSLLLILSLVVSIFLPGIFYWMLAAWGIKIMVDFILMWPVAGFLHQRKILWHFPLPSVVYPFYVATTLVLAIFAPGQWKSRPLKT
jgi:cellulose synthase/poly-beta-1,6-N-acetylglucosamine synthase-like glycosyltransferase